ncbi:splicing factor 3B subunit 10 (SF3b10), putative [Talaromyces stipitatus ATCC 10500]|uniref:Splicing factor 3B subunit 10 (SF3b10), putative n=1 Tax=Talaromyces stipitatus (strain ATCC 10500 / CBS 375.48 / QM 6759 / NRRL 1006) TaxID=441959 RepID=B8M5U8_TALSN|nr:splicing factor 3B subunit 10 (SF3b10), putative [Talaromyces stipitatus ATCC 10500]EED20075.1 splicing factor 3B subunit 10 (SF3b10), putative [Talaromyces stipitatus ATCC 10500]
MADKLRTLQNLEALQTRYVGTGHADTTKYEWTSNIVRDSYASYIGHPPLLEYMAIGIGEPKEKVRSMMIEKMIRGAGNPPEDTSYPTSLDMEGMRAVTIEDAERNSSRGLACKHLRCQAECSNQLFSHWLRSSGLMTESAKSCRRLWGWLSER